MNKYEHVCIDPFNGSFEPLKLPALDHVEYLLPNVPIVFSQLLCSETCLLYLLTYWTLNLWRCMIPWYCFVAVVLENITRQQFCNLWKASGTAKSQTDLCYLPLDYKSSKGTRICGKESKKKWVAVLLKKLGLNCIAYHEYQSWAACMYCSIVTAQLSSLSTVSVLIEHRLQGR